MTKSSSHKRTTAIIIALLAWFAIVLQLYIMLGDAPAIGFSPFATIVNFLSYFTILSNLFVAITLSVKEGSVFSGNKIRSAIAVYIVIVGLVYNLVLRKVWSPHGWQLVADNLLHVAIPLLYVVFWYFFVPKGILKWKHLLPWLIFPLLYLVYSLARGALTGWYPYPFLNADQTGYSKVALNSSLVFAAFLIIGLAVIAINRAGPSAKPGYREVKRT
ncbi:MAG TPA: Pr6Pr family membrane protein [Chitinophagaceae bacterium]|nr:Pr6Pr family membrane protein [Chitinophagaceae bacterium]